MTPTRLGFLAAVAVVCAAVGWGLVQVVFAWTGRLVPVPWLAAGALWLVAAAVGYWTWSIRPRLQRRPGTRPLAAIVAARSAALALAASRIGAVACGFYAGIAIAMTAHLPTQSGRATLWAALAAAGGAAALVGTGLWLERCCRLPAGPPDPPDSAGGDGAAATR